MALGEIVCPCQHRALCGTGWQDVRAEYRPWPWCACLKGLDGSRSWRPSSCGTESKYAFTCVKRQEITLPIKRFNSNCLPFCPSSAPSPFPFPFPFPRRLDGFPKVDSWQSPCNKLSSSRQAHSCRDNLELLPRAATLPSRSRGHLTFNFNVIHRDSFVLKVGSPAAWHFRDFYFSLSFAASVWPVSTGRVLVYCCLD